MFWKLFKLKVCPTFNDLIFADISAFAVASGGRGIENSKYLTNKDVYYKRNFWKKYFLSEKTLRPKNLTCSRE